MNDFTASNGVRFGRDSDGELTLDGERYDFIYKEHEDALREWFRAEEDTRLGRWRDPENPEFVVYPHENVRCDTGLEVDEVRVLWEIGGGSKVIRRGEDMGSGAGDAARRYFAAHPPRNPWETAEPGEVWVLRIDHKGVSQEYGGEVACYLDERGDFVAVKGLMRIDRGDAQIVSGRRVWPVGGSEPTE